jgi:hypothetical protein
MDESSMWQVDVGQRKLDHQFYEFWDMHLIDFHEIIFIQLYGVVCVKEVAKSSRSFSHACAMSNDS